MDFLAIAQSAASEFAPVAPLARRLPRAIRCRLASYWARLRGRRSPMAEAALDWLVRALEAAWASPASRQQLCTATLGPAAATLARLGELDACQRWIERLCAMQLPDGSFPDGMGRPSRFHTAQALRGLLAWGSAIAKERISELDEGAPSLALRASVGGAGGFADRLDASSLTLRVSARAAGYLARQFDESGQPRVADAPIASIDRWGPKALWLSWLPPLLETAKTSGDTALESLVWRSLRRQLKTVDLSQRQAPTAWWAYVPLALIELGQVEAARLALRQAAVSQTRVGCVSNLPGARHVSSAALAYLALAWYRLGTPEDCRRADAALAALARRQARDGSFPMSWGAASRGGRRPSLLTAVVFLEALQWQVRRTAESSVDRFPAQIDQEDGRLQAVVRWCRQLPPATRILDAGCGRGRFLRHIQRHLPAATLVGVDIAAASLSQLPPGVTGRQGDLLHLPAATGEFDAAICIEALEHSLLPRRAIAELCRVVKPGGSILIIDKNASHQALSDHQPWERWFEPRELADWLSPYCDAVSVAPVAHGRHSRPTGLFLCCTARRDRLAVRSAA